MGDPSSWQQSEKSALLAALIVPALLLTATLLATLFIALLVLLSAALTRLPALLRASTIFLILLSGILGLSALLVALVLIIHFWDPLMRRG